MLQIRANWDGAAAIAAIVLLWQALPAAAQNGRTSAQTCRNNRGYVVCDDAYSSRAAGGAHAYERWSDGSAATGRSGAADTYEFPQYLGGHNAWYGFGR